ncbi:MAG: PLDc N-terminal domain-containing protein [Syntrophobacteraceae bacterium]|jgi:hypothetical protein
MSFDPLNLLVLIAILIVPMIPTFWAIADLPRRRFASLKSKVLWFALVSTLPCLGAIIYILLGRRYTQPALIVDAETLSERGRQ